MTTACAGLAHLTSGLQVIRLESVAGLMAICRQTKRVQVVRGTDCATFNSQQAFGLFWQGRDGTQAQAESDRRTSQRQAATPRRTSAWLLRLERTLRQGSRRLSAHRQLHGTI